MTDDRERAVFVSFDYQELKWSVTPGYVDESGTFKFQGGGKQYLYNTREEAVEAAKQRLALVRYADKQGPVIVKDSEISD